MSDATLSHDIRRTRDVSYRECMYK